VADSDIVQEDQNAVSLFNLFLSLWRYRKLITVITSCATFIAVGVSIASLALPPERSFLPNLYTPRANMLVNNTGSQGSGIAAAINASGLGGLASLTGLSVSGGPTFSSLAVYVVNSDTMLDSLIERFDLIKRYKIKKYVIAESRKKLKKYLTADYDEESGVFTVSFSDYDPVFARDVINYCVDYLSRRFDDLGLDKNLQQKENLEKSIETAYESIRSLEKETQSLELSATVVYNGPARNITLETMRINLELQAQQQIYTQLKVQLELVNTAIASETPVFQVLETAQVPDRKSGPSRGTLCAIVTLAAFFFSVFLAFTLAALENIRNDPEAMEKFRAADGKRNKE
jgi:uncharacterized protein involved in exopolysaccharide biosynthesis